MKNTLTISTYNPTLLSKTDDGTNRFFIRLRCDLGKNPRIIFSDSTVTPTTSDFLYEVSSAKWLGSGTLTFTVSDNDGSQAYSVDKFSGSSGTANLMMLEDSSFAYHFVDVNAASGDEYGLSITGRILSIILGGGSSSVELPTGTDGRGIVSITKTGTSGLVDTYTILYTDDTTSTFTVTNGEDGDDGRGIVTISKTGTSGLVDTYTITYTSGSDSTFTVTNGKDGVDGQDGAPGAAAGFGTPTASIDANTGTPSVTVTASGPDTAKVFSFDFKNLKGAQGQQGATGATGNGISNIAKTGTSGLVDTYTIYYTNGTTDTFTVTNGADGASTWSEVQNKPFSSVGSQFSTNNDVLKLAKDLAYGQDNYPSATGSGTEASPQVVEWNHRLALMKRDGTYTTANILTNKTFKYSKTANTDSDGGTTFTFTGISASNPHDVYCDVENLPYKSFTISGTTATVKFPATSASTITCMLVEHYDFA